jgi:hypothetical protein
MRIAVVTLALLLGACASGGYEPGAMLTGRIISLADGTIFPMQYEFAASSGKMTATNPVTGEIFQGTYTGIQETHVVQHESNSFWGDSDQSVETSDVAHAVAVLAGNKGTVLNLKIQVKIGNPPTGFGDGEDNKGVKYSVQF